MRINSIDNAQKQQSFKARIFNSTDLNLKPEYLTPLSDLAETLGCKNDSICFRKNRVGTIEVSAYKYGDSKSVFTTSVNVQHNLAPDSYGLKLLEILRKSKQAINSALKS